MSFIDEAKIDVQGGAGGNGCLAFRREKYVARGGPSGGDGGHGGSVYLVGDESLNTLYHLRFQQRYAAQRGRHGEGSNKTGKSGSDLEVAVPLGTQVVDDESGDQLGELLSDGERMMVAAGGRGGKGNARFASATNQAPTRHEPGREGEERRLRLELKLLADVGVVGLPNAGKSTLISSLSAARPKIADYPFTTLVPSLGVVSPELRAESFARPFVIADLPGLIAGAAAGAGLGHRFLRHIERCRVLIHLVDLAVGEAPVADELATVEDELAAFDGGLMQRPRLLVGSKIDAVDEERRQQLAAAAAERGLPAIEISSVSHRGLRELVGRLEAMLETARRQEAMEPDGPDAEPGEER